ncbi:hypothetical protein ANO14919_070700 [Xylariales sp. No.14919]|nr:hypothetical protein ANO14919_070700 [Xylariales sp. No.14919]
MVSPTKPLRGILPSLQSRGPSLPSVCYDTCNNANIEAQSVGKNPALCEKDSTFYFYYNACSDCLHNTLSDAEAKDNLNSVFSPWTDYCDETAPLPSTSGGGETVTGTPPPAEETGFVTITSTEVVSGSRTIFHLSRSLISFAPLSSTTVISITTSQDGHSTVWTFVKTFSLLPNSDSPTSTSQNMPSPTTPQETSKLTSQEPEVINTATASGPASTVMSDSTQRSQAWVAGPVIGAVAGVAILLLGTWLLFRVKRKRGLKRKGHELHGESALKSELESTVPPQELDGQEQDRGPAELPGTNV